MRYKSCDLFMLSTLTTHNIPCSLKGISYRVNPSTTSEDYNLRAVSQNMRYEYYIGHLIVKLYDCAFNDFKTAKMCGLCLNSVRQPLGNKIRVGQISAILPFPV